MGVGRALEARRPGLGNPILKRVGVADDKKNFWRSTTASRGRRIRVIIASGMGI